MRVLLAFDKFKDALPAAAACAAAASALHATHPDWTLDLCPLTDGGEGFAEILTEAAGGTRVVCTVTGPRGRPVPAAFGWIDPSRIPPAARTLLEIDPLPAGGHLAVLDLAAASGLALLPPGERDPWHTTTAGTGELLVQARMRGASALLLGLGGSATNDLGLGALTALGCRSLDATGVAVPAPVPADWERIVRIEFAAGLRLPPLRLAVDVVHPLLGPHGATATFGPQKGLRPDDLPRFEAQVARMAALLGAAGGTPPPPTETPGAGAAGGCAYGLLAGCGARLVPGFALVSAWLDLPARVAAADLVVTGEGRFDATSFGGKGPGALVAAARAASKPVQVFAGTLEGPPDASSHVLTPPDLPLAEALPRTAALLAAAVARHL